MANEGRGGGSQSASPYDPASYSPSNVHPTAGPIFSVIDWFFADLLAGLDHPACAAYVILLIGAILLLAWLK